MNDKNIIKYVYIDKENVLREETDMNGNLLKYKNIFLKHLNKNYIQINVQQDNSNSLTKLSKKNEKEVENMIDNYLESDIAFLSVEMEYKGEKYPILLKNNEYNFYVVNNQFDKLFFIYYMKMFYNINEEVENFNYILHILDHNVNEIDVTSDETILIHLNDYLIKKVDDEYVNLGEE